MPDPAQAPASPLRLSERPLLWLAPAQVDPATVAALRALCTPESLAAAGVDEHRDETGRIAELPFGLDPVLAETSAQVAETVGLPLPATGHVRMRWYAEGQGHPPHVDDYEIDGERLVATALLCLEAPTGGGQTAFLDAHEGPVLVTHRPGQLVGWHNVGPHGHADPAARHLAVPVAGGSKLVLSWFFYASPDALVDAERGERAPADRRAAARTAPSPAPPSLRGFGRCLAVIDDGVPDETVTLLQEACDARGVTLRCVDPRTFDFFPERQLRAGDLLFRPAVSMHAMRVEQHLWHPKVATFYRDESGGPFFSNVNATGTFAAAGLSVPRTFWLSDGDRDLLRAMVERLGGFPVVVKALGYSHGVGVLRADSFETLFPIVDFALAQKHKPLLTSYIDDATHWRLVVVGDRVVSSYRNAQPEGDFRTMGADDPDDYAATPPPEAETLAVQACHALRVDHGGVDVLSHASGRHYLLEANFPCYYPQSQLAHGDDISGAMVDHLLDRAEALDPEGAATRTPLPDLG